MDWGTLIFNYGRNEVRNFLIANALFWLDEYHIDGLRVDAVASMLYLDYSRKPGEWIPNGYGGRENLEAIYFLKRFNEVCYERHPGIMTIAEESTAWPGVSRPDAISAASASASSGTWAGCTTSSPTWRRTRSFRRFHQGDITFSLIYAFHEHFVLVLSHDEVVHGKGSLLDKMPGDLWQKFAQPADVLRVDVRASRQEAALHGRRVRPMARVESRHSPRLAPLQFPGARRPQAPRASTSTGSTTTSPRSSTRTTPTKASSGSTSTTRDNSVVALHAQIAHRRHPRLRRQRHPVSAREWHRRVSGEGWYEEILNTDAQTYGGGNIPATTAARHAERRLRGRANRTRILSACRRWPSSASRHAPPKPAETSRNPIRSHPTG